MNSTPPSQLPAAVKAAIERIEEAYSVIYTLEAAWDSPCLNDESKLRTIRSVRRSMIDVAAGLEESVDIPN